MVYLVHLQAAGLATRPAHPVLITGATRGLGKAAAHELVRRGRPVLVGGRSARAVEAVVRELQEAGGIAHPFVADLASLESLNEAIDELDGISLHGIVTNAGITTRRDARSADGFELTFAVNVLAHQLLLCRMSAQLKDGGRIVVVASGVHEPDNKLARRLGVPVPRWVGTRNLALPDEAPADMRLAAGPLRYSTSKLGNVLQARGLQAHLRRAGRAVDVFAIDPGLMVDTDLLRELPSFLQPGLRAIGRLFTPHVDNMRLSSVSAAHIAMLVEHSEWQGRGFTYLDGDRAKPPSADARRDDLMKELWETSLSLLELERCN